MRALLKEIIYDEELDMSIRVEAVQAFRRYPCEDVRELFLKILFDFRIDSEIRIASYLQVMRCPNYIIVRKIKYLLEIEEVNQGKFNVKKYI